MLRRGNYRREAGLPQSDESSFIKNVDAETLDFIQKYLTSYLKWEVLRYYSENPTAAETPRAFARRLGKDVRQIAEAMKSLARSGILSNGNGSGENASYTLAGGDADRSTLQRIAETARANNRFRLLLNYHITKASLARFKARNP